MKLSKGLEEAIINFDTERLDRKILKGLINFEEQDGEDLILMIKKLEMPHSPNRVSRGDSWHHAIGNS